MITTVREAASEAGVCEAASEAGATMTTITTPRDEWDELLLWADSIPERERFADEPIVEYEYLSAEEAAAKYGEWEEWSLGVVPWEGGLQGSEHEVPCGHNNHVQLPTPPGNTRGTNLYTTFTNWHKNHYRDLLFLKSSFTRGGLDSDEAESTAILAVWKAAIRWNPYQGASFRVFARVCMRNALMNALQKQERETVTQPLQEDCYLKASPAVLVIESIILREALKAIPDSDLLILHAAGFSDAELGEASVIKMRRTRAGIKLHALLAA